ncbi:MAG: TRAP transporter substrate-binding protein [Chloroflexota bacterium]
MTPRRLPLGLLAVVLGVGLLATACGGAVSTPQPTSAPPKPAAAEPTKPAAEAAKPAAEAPKPTAAAQQAATPTYQFKMSHHEPATAKLHLAFEKWANTINQKTNGQVKITIYPGETLAKGRDIVSATQSGITDIGWTIVAFFPGQFPLTEVYQLPVLGVNSSKQGGKALWDVVSANPDIQKEWGNFKLLGFTSSGTQWISTAKKPVRTIDDVKGMKLRVAGWGGTELFKGLGASPINMPPPEMYEALSKGILDGIVFDWQGINSSRLYEVLNYASPMPIILQPQALIMNQNKWKALPPDIQKVFDEFGGKYYAETVGAEGFDSADPEGEANFKKLNKEIINFGPAEVEKWRNAVKPVWKAWVDSVKGKGLDGQKPLDQLLEAISKNK